MDFYGQATLLWNSMSSWNCATSWRRTASNSAVDHPHIQERVVAHLSHVDYRLAAAVAANLGIAVPEEGTPIHGRFSLALSQVPGWSLGRRCRTSGSPATATVWSWTTARDAGRRGVQPWDGRVHPRVRRRDPEPPQLRAGRRHGPA